MANYEFPSKSSTTTSSVSNTTSSPNDENAPVTNATVKQQVESVKKAIKEKAKEEKKETEKEKKDRERRERERKEKLDKIWNGVKGGLTRVTDKVSDLGEEVSSNITQEVFGSGFYATQMNNIFGKTLRGISDSLKKIGSFLATSLGKMWHWMTSAVKKFRKIFSRNGLFGTIHIYFRWMKMKLTNGFSKLWKMLESIKLFSILGKLLGGAGAAIKGTVVAAGDLIKSLVSAILGTAAGKALLAGLSSLGATLKGVTLSSLLGAIAKASVLAMPLALSGDSANDYYINEANEKYKKGEISEEEYKKTLNSWGTNPELQTPEGKKEHSDIHNEFVKLASDENKRNAVWKELVKTYPNAMKVLAKKHWLDSDYDKDGIYDDPTYSQFLQVIDNIQAGDGGTMRKFMTPESLEELKNKNKLKNIAKVSST